MHKGSSAAIGHYSEAFSYLNENYEKFAMIVAKIGKPVEDFHQPTAFVALDENGKFSFHLNPDFFNTLSTEEKGFVIAHEASHVLYDHLTDHTDPYYTNHHAYTLATECHVNDALIDMGMTGPKDKITGEDVLKMSTAGMRLRDIYDLVIKEVINKENDALENLLEKASESCSECVHLENTNITEEEKQDINVARNQIIIDIICDDDINYQEESSDEKSPLGLPEDIADAINAQNNKKISNLITINNTHDVETSKIDLAKEHGVEIDFINFLEKINPSLVSTKNGKHGIIPQPSFRKPNSRYLSLTNVSIPIWDNNDYDHFSNEEDGNGKEVILFALDFSASVDRGMAKIMEQLMSVIPLDKAEVYACTFSDYAIEYIPGKEYQKTASGCTDFAAVTGYIDRLMEDNPHMNHPTVIMLTDAGGGFNTQSVRVSYQEEVSRNTYGKIIDTTVPSQENIDRYYRWALFDHGDFEIAKNNINEYSYSKTSFDIKEENMYNLSDLINY